MKSPQGWEGGREGLHQPTDTVRDCSVTSPVWEYQSGGQIWTKDQVLLRSRGKMSPRCHHQLIFPERQSGLTVKSVSYCRTNITSRPRKLLTNPSHAPVSRPCPPIPPQRGAGSRLRRRSAPPCVSSSPILCVFGRQFNRVQLKRGTVLFQQLEILLRHFNLLSLVCFAPPKALESVALRQTSKQIFSLDNSGS